MLSIRRLLDEFTCGLCEQRLSDPVTTVDCLHTFCSRCLDQYLFSKQRCCPTCSRPQTPGITIKPHVTFNALHRIAMRMETALPEEEAVVVEDEKNDTNEVDAATELISQEQAKLEQQHQRADKLLKQQQQQKKKPTKKKVEEDTSPPPPPPPPSRRLLIAYSSKLPASRVDQLRQMFRADELFSSTSSSPTSSLAHLPPPTHFVAKTSAEGWCAPTFKYYRALSQGACVVSQDWLDVGEQAIRAEDVGAVVDGRFRVRSSTCTFDDDHNGPTGRLLFAGLTLLLGPYSEQHTMTKAQARELIELNGGRVVDLGGDSDGTGMSKGSGGAGEGVVVLVGHPRSFTHENNQCQFCGNVLTAWPECKLVDTTWIILCIGAGRVHSMDERLLTA